MKTIQCTGFMQRVPELLCEPNQLVLENNAPSLAKIMLAHESGRPIDATLIRDYPYNEIENNPFHEKGLDLADLPRIAKELGETKEALEKDIANQKLARTQEKAPNMSEPPEKVETYNE